MSRKHEINPGPMREFLPEGAKLYMRPELPKIEFRKGRAKYKMTDFSLLHPYGWDVFAMCLDAMATTPNARSNIVLFEKEVDKDTLEIICDIVSGFDYKVSKSGKNGFTHESHAITGTITEEKEDGKTSVEFTFNTEFAKHVYEYSNEHKGEKITLAELVMYDTEESEKEILESLAKAGELS